jgi:hypothetical protein
VNLVAFAAEQETQGVANVRLVVGDEHAMGM